MEQLDLCQTIKKNSNYCVFQNCFKRASFKFEGETIKYCSAHKLDNMIDVV